MHGAQRGPRGCRDRERAAKGVDAAGGGVHTGLGREVDRERAAGRADLAQGREADAACCLQAEGAGAVGADVAVDRDVAGLRPGAAGAAAGRARAGDHAGVHAAGAGAAPP